MGPGLDSASRVARLRVVSCRLFYGLLCVVVPSLAALGWLYLKSQSGGTEKSVGVLWVVMTVGTVGGFVGIQRRLKGMEDADLDLLATSNVHVVFPPVVGGVLAALLYLMFLSGLLEGALFPEFEADTLAASVTDFTQIFHTHAVGYKDYAKLVFWSFVAGFSERFVVDLIGQLKHDVKPQT